MNQKRDDVSFLTLVAAKQFKSKLQIAAYNKRIERV